MAGLISLASAAGARTSLTLLALAVAARFGSTELPEHLSFLSDNLGLALLVALVIAEEFIEQDEDLQHLTSYINYLLRGAGGALASTAFETLGGGELPPAIAAVAGAGIAVATHHLRMRLYDVVRGFGESFSSPRTWLAWLEAGGVVGVVAAAFLAPALALAFVVVASMGALTILLIRRTTERRVYRRPCPNCQTRIRVEARLCPNCKASVPIVKRRGVEG